uniref:Apolipoprotein L n=1 Tax=Seriola dumerili TaxID=41447 RepID=A0A3B4VP75_SERDU
MNLCFGDRRRAKLQKELAAVLEDTVGGLEKLGCFLDAVGRLAVASLPVSTEENQVLRLPNGTILEHFEVLVIVTQIICPLLLEFKRDAQVFFLPRLQIMSHQLDKCIKTTQKICEELEKRDDQRFRLVFLLQEELCRRFITEFNKRRPRMRQFLHDLEDIADQLDKMKKTAKISGVAGGSVGAVGGVLSIVGLALTPVTAGVTLGLAMTGLSLGLTSLVTSAVTTTAETRVKRKHQKKASEVFQSFMEDVQRLQDCLQEATGQPVSRMEASKIDVAQGIPRVLTDIGGIGTNTETGVEGGALDACDVPQMTAARTGLITVSAFFLGFNILSICKNSLSLARAAKGGASQSIRATAKLWHLEMDSWEKICGSLCQSLSTSKNKAILDTPFYPEKKENKKERDTESTANDMNDKEQASKIKHM